MLAVMYIYFIFLHFIIVYLCTTFILNKLPHVLPQRCCASLTGLAYSLGCNPSPQSRTLACSHTAAVF